MLLHLQSGAGRKVDLIRKGEGVGLRSLLQML